MDLVLINPTDEEIRRALVKAIDDANRRLSRVRMVSRTDCNSWLNAKSWIKEDANFACWDGGGVSNRYPGKPASSVVGVAWWTGKRRHFRFYGDRVAAPRSSYAQLSPRWFGMSDHDLMRSLYVQVVYPCLLPSHPPIKDKGLISELLRALKHDCLDRASWMALGDRLTELQEVKDTKTKSYKMTPEQCRLALQSLDAIKA
jgi:hypothetical protein